MTAALDRLCAAGMAGPSSSPQPERYPLCSCGCVEPHVIARRETADGKIVRVYSDGDVCLHMFALRGLGVPRSAYGKRTRIRAVRLVMDDFGVFDLAEIPVLVKVAESTFAHTYSSETDRRNHAIAIARKQLARKAVPR